MEIQDLINRVREKAGTGDQETQALLARVATSATILAARSSVGEDVTQDMLHLKAQAANLSAEFQEILGDEVRNWLMERIGFVIVGVLTG